MNKHQGTLLEVIRALQLNQAVYELFLSVGSGDVSAADLSNMTNTAIGLNEQALTKLNALIDDVPDVGDMFRPGAFIEISPQSKDTIEALRAAKLLQTATQEGE